MSHIDKQMGVMLYLYIDKLIDKAYCYRQIVRDRDMVYLQINRQTRIVYKLLQSFLEPPKDVLPSFQQEMTDRQTGLQRADSTNQIKPAIQTKSVQTEEINMPW